MLELLLAIDPLETVNKIKIKLIQYFKKELIKLQLIFCEMCFHEFFVVVAEITHHIFEGK